MYEKTRWRDATNEYAPPPMPLGALMLLILVFAVVIGLLADAFTSWLDLPYIYQSWETGECIRVEDPAAESEGRKPWTCDSLPERYELVWVR